MAGFGATVTEVVEVAIVVITSLVVTSVVEVAVEVV